MSEFEKMLIPIIVVLGSVFELCLVSIAIDISAIRKTIDKMQCKSNAKNKTLDVR